jgi:ribulose-phosphate 3-epimerase
MTNVKIAPSILAADFARLGEQIAAVETAGADQIHIDIMDGHFVPNLTMGPAVVEAVRRVTKLPLDVHLMVDQPDLFIEPFAKAGANALTFHIEIAQNAPQIIDDIHRLGLRAGIALRPSTDVERLTSVLPLVDIVLVMTVEPGFGGQGFLDVSPARIAQTRANLDAGKSSADLSVDGGIDQKTAGLVVRSGATVLVAGTSVFRGAGGIAASLRGLRDAVRG